MASTNPDAEPHAVILDVGHGNAAVLFDGSQAVVIDAGPGDLVTETLERYAVTEIAAVIVSHRHHDHTSELPSLLSSPQLVVRRLFVNADPGRPPDSQFERHLRAAFNDSWQRHGTELHQANETLGALMGTRRLIVRVLAPRPGDALVGVGARQEGGGTVHAHARAVVVKVSLAEGRRILFGADLDHRGFDELMEDPGSDLTAEVLVYPHHGGRTGADDEERFATRLTQAVGPEVVLFSNGRDRFDNPRVDVIRGVRRAREENPVRAVCTQLSHRCSTVERPSEARLDASLGSRGRRQGHCCLGSVRIGAGVDVPLLAHGVQHLRFVIDEVGPAAMCVGDLPAEDEE